jgi:hypothetical protein
VVANTLLEHLSMTAQDILAAMRADCIPVGTSGRWTVSRRTLDPKQAAILNAAERAKRPNARAVPPGTYTWLWCLTTETMMQLPGEAVMNDFPCELGKHMEFIMRASGRVLIGGLGLGCVVRGLLARGRVEHIDVIERSSDVIKLCAADLMRDDRITLHKQDARAARVAKIGPWDWAWLDLWQDPEKDDKHLQLIHLDIIQRLHKHVKNPIGCWAMPRRIRRGRLGGREMKVIF